MKPLYLLLFILLHLQLYSQPSLKPAYYLADLPHLTVEQLTNKSAILSYDHPEGILLYNEKDDYLKLYENLAGYERLGRIIKLFNIKNITVVSMEDGSVLISDRAIKTLDFSINGGIAEGDSKCFFLQPTLGIATTPNHI